MRDLPRDLTRGPTRDQARDRDPARDPTELGSELLAGRLAVSEEPEDGSVASRIARVAQHADRGEHAAAAREAAALLEARTYDIRLIGFYLFGLFLQRGISYLPALLARVAELVTEDLAALRPARRKLQVLSSATAWLFENVSARLLFHCKQRDATWDAWREAADPSLVEEICAGCTKVTLALEAVIEAPLAAVPLARVRRWTNDELRRALGRREQAAERAAVSAGAAHPALAAGGAKGAAAGGAAAPSPPPPSPSLSPSPSPPPPSQSPSLSPSPPPPLRAWPVPAEDWAEDAATSEPPIDAAAKSEVDSDLEADFAPAPDLWAGDEPDEPDEPDEFDDEFATGPEGRDGPNGEPAQALQDGRASLHPGLDRSTVPGRAERKAPRRRAAGRGSFAAAAGAELGAELSAEVPTSPALAALQVKLRGFQELVARGELAKAAVVASDVRAVLANFDPVVFFPTVFAGYFKVLHQVIEELTPYFERAEQPSWNALESYYRADMRGFFED